MKIETKYNAGQRVYFFKDGQIQRQRINSVMVEQTFFEYSLKAAKSEIKIEYYFLGFGFFSENDLFTTKEELLKSLK